VTEKRRVTPPHISLLRAASGAPAAQTVHAEVRTDASVPFDPSDAPDYLDIVNARFGALVFWRVDVSWAIAQQIQLWLIGPPGPGSLVPVGAPADQNTRENALALLIANLQGGGPPPAPFAQYIGTHLTTDVSHGSYTMVVGITNPITRDDYQNAWVGAIAALRPPPPAPALSWHADVVQFLKFMLGQPSSQEEFIQLASNVGDLTQLNPVAPNAPIYPMINIILN
jgi:hypothetical protein